MPLSGRNAWRTLTEMKGAEMTICSKCSTGYDSSETSCPKCGLAALAMDSSKGDWFLRIAECLSWLYCVWIIFITIIACFTSKHSSFGFVECDNRIVVIIGNLVGGIAHSLFMVALAIVFRRVRGR
jgi:hypothetical protein